MNIDIVEIGDWLLQQWNLFGIICYICVVMGLLFVVPNIYRKKRLVLSVSTRIISSGIVGGFAFGILIPFAVIPLALLLRLLSHERIDLSRDTWYFFQLLLTSIFSFPIWKVFPRLFVDCFILGFPIGLLIGVLTKRSAVASASRIESSQSFTVSSYLSRQNFMIWCLFGAVIGYAVTTVFGVIVGFFTGLFLGLFAFLLGFSPKPVETPGLSLKKTLIYFFLRILGFWFIIGSALILIAIYMIVVTFTFRVLPSNAIISIIINIFVDIIIILFFWFFIRQNQKLGQQKSFEKKDSDERDETGYYPGKQKLVINYLKFRKALTTGSISGLLLYSAVLGGSVAFIVGIFYGFPVGIVFEAVFTILGLGFGTDCGITLIYKHILGPVIADWIEDASEKKLIIVGTVLAFIGATLPLLQHLLSQFIATRYKDVLPPFSVIAFINSKTSISIIISSLHFLVFLYAVLLRT